MFRFVGTDGAHGADEVDEEIAYHLDTRARALEARGLDPTAARRQALHEFGDVEDTRAYCRALDARRERRMSLARAVDELRQDLRIAVRTLRRAPGFAGVAVLTLALGIAASTAVFGVVDPVLLRRLPYPDAERLVVIRQLDTQRGDTATQITFGDFTDIRRRTDVLDGVGVVVDAGATLSGDGEPRRIRLRFASPSLLSMLGVAPAIGRAFVAAEEDPASERVAMLSHPFWMQHYGGDSAVLGRTVHVDGVARAIVGVLPPGFALGDPRAAPELLAPMLATPARTANRTMWGYLAIGRLADGVSLERARAVLHGLGATLETMYPETNMARSFAVVSFAETVRGTLRRPLFAVLGGSLFVLLIASANLGNLLLARTVSRHRELAIRLAVGATRGRLIRQLTVEATVLAVLGGVLGACAAVAAVGGARRSGWELIPTLTSATVDHRALVFCLALTLVTGLASALVPALLSARTDPHRLLGSGLRASTERWSSRIQTSLVATEIALAFVLLAGAGLMISSVTTALRSDPGFDPSSITTFRVSPTARYDTRAELGAFYDELEAALAAIPGVTAVGFTNNLAFTGNRMGSWLSRADRPVPRGETPPEVGYSMVSPGYFAAMGIPVVRGRAFEPHDRGLAHVAVISETAAEAIFPGEDPIGKRIHLGPPGDDWHEIVGVVRSIRHEGVAAAPLHTGYELYGQHWDVGMSVVIRSPNESAAVLREARARLRAIDPDVPLSEVASMAELGWQSLRERRFVLFVLAGFAAAAVALAAIGVYGVMAYAVRQRRQELGIRVALGAESRDIIAGVLRRSVPATCIGVGVGLLGALGLTRLLSSLLVGVTPTDPVLLGGAALVLAAAALTAAYLPARQAARVDPTMVLREE